MSTGFHYFETIRQSLALQWVDKAQAPIFLGQMIAVNAGFSQGSRGLGALNMGNLLGNFGAKPNGNGNGRTILNTV